ncbi:hypothetical protein [Bradyrhizobium sp. 150]|uniref:hypothetical protein n=1 Tax=Bradyrhizobium sp. 150 TaxID=2782625 RepID=UPI001FF99D2C|nr:hypothetical protein [Bradyrhizobium sp. 150]MCK1670399.1 hypothetical protein [Bradyrhizobium sp. 150]
MSDADFDDFEAIEGLDELENLDGDQLREALTDHAQTRGLLIAYRACLQLCGDKKAPAAARGQAASNVFRAVGLYAKRESDDSRAKEPHEMEPEEFGKASAKALRDLPRLLARLEKKGDPDSGVFG